METKANPHKKFAVLKLDVPQTIARENGIIKSQYLLDVDNPPNTPPKQGKKYFSSRRLKNICNKLFFKYS